jgi:hypothetical protein
VLNVKEFGEAESSYMWKEVHLLAWKIKLERPDASKSSVPKNKEPLTLRVG